MMGLNKFLVALGIVLLSVSPAQGKIGFKKSGSYVLAKTVVPMWSGAKKAGRGIVRVNDDERVRAGVRCIQTVMTVAGAYYFVKNSIVPAKNTY